MPTTGVSKCPDSIQELARHILREQCRLIETNARQASRNHSAEAVHDLRVAIRRLRTALRVFDKALPGKPRKLRRRLQVMNRQLGPARDAQVWLSVVRTRARRKTATPLPAAWKQCMKHAETACKAREIALTRILKSTAVSKTREYCHSLPHAPSCKEGGDHSIQAYFARKLLRGYGHLLREGATTDVESDEEAHALRRHCRRARYLSEFAEPVLGSPARKLAHHFKRVADALGDRHDADVQMALLDAMPASPENLRHLIVGRKHAAHREFIAAWRALTSSRFRKSIQGRLQSAKGEHP